MLTKALQPISAVVLAAMIATAVIFIPGASVEVVASAPLHGGKGDRLDIRRLGTQCSEQAWPYFEASCLRDRRVAMGRAKPARIVTADRVSGSR